jgi:hypothetical protein
VDEIPKTEEEIRAFYKKKTLTRPIDIIIWNLIYACGGWMGKPVLKSGLIHKYPNLVNHLKNLPDYKARLHGVHITNQDYEEVVSHNDSDETVFFFDPPYKESDGLGYASGSEIFDFDRFAAVVSQTKGKWVITINDSPYIRKLFKKFVITPVIIEGHKQMGNYGKSTTIGGKDRKELIITNFAPPSDFKEFAPKKLKFVGGIDIPRSQFIQEHENLLKVLKEGKPKQLQAEYEDQSKELSKVLLNA